MKITYDLDGTLFTYTRELLEFAFFMQKIGHQVGLLTGRNMQDIETNILPMLRQYNFVPDFYIGRTFEPQEPDWDQNIKNQVWKAQMLKEHHISIHFDDQCEGPIGDDHGIATIIKV